jgi:hypothetical protein
MSTGNGPTGPTGATGQQGFTGIEGLCASITGPTGIRVDGEQGCQGPTGPIGRCGLQGDTGPTGEDGPFGNKGPTGDIGITGNNGPRGPEGPEGPTGITGFTGITGLRGPDGSTGDTGPTGESGEQGPDGITGPTGFQGYCGPFGPKGEFTGATGVIGPTGPTGWCGNWGCTGITFCACASQMTYTVVPNCTTSPIDSNSLMTLTLTNTSDINSLSSSNVEGWAVQAGDNCFTVYLLPGGSQIALPLSFNVCWFNVPIIPPPPPPGEELILEVQPNSPVILRFFGEVNVTIDWGDGHIDLITSAGEIEHDYPEPEPGFLEPIRYNVKISGSLTGFGWENETVPDAGRRITKVIQWGDLGLISLSGAFKNNIFNVEIPNNLPSTVRNLNRMFENASIFNQNIGGLDISNINDMNFMLSNCGMDTENYSKTLIGWANFVFNNKKSIINTLGANNMRYNNITYEGIPYDNAVSARNFLIININNSIYSINKNYFPDSSLHLILQKYHAKKKFFLTLTHPRGSSSPE